MEDRQATGRSRGLWEGLKSLRQTVSYAEREGERQGHTPMEVLQCRANTVDEAVRSGQDGCHPLLRSHCVVQHPLVAASPIGRSRRRLSNNVQPFRAADGFRDRWRVVNCCKVTYEGREDSHRFVAGSGPAAPILADQQARPADVSRGARRSEGEKCTAVSKHQLILQQFTTTPPFAIHAVVALLRSYVFCDADRAPGHALERVRVRLTDQATLISVPRSFPKSLHANVGSVSFYRPWPTPSPFLTLCATCPASNVRAVDETPERYSQQSVATYRVECQPIRVLTLATGVQNVARATGIGIDARYMGDPRLNLLASGIIRHDSHERKSGSGPYGSRPQVRKVGGERSNH
ncbi:hypothetical protein PR048_021167 [Dryococelus australis]|uniref:Uncharacterized protein n=1 Tax=Dryococelus australis TaxID=614101 RepID=A0ABQ9GXF2_9NEOP|nr:hypothetical protein PR048_021167 [Dryococelus australis]